MKSFGILIAIFLLPAMGMAQGKLKPMNEAATASTQTDYSSSNQTNLYKYNATRVQQSTGKVYSEQDLLAMPRRDVNTVAGMVTGVDSRAGTNEVPHIRGAESSGTAYYVDGVRVYGALPIMTK